MKRTVILAGVLTIALASSAPADTYIKTQIESSGFAGIGGMKGETETWISGSRAVEKSNFKVRSPLLRLFMSEEKGHAIVDLDKRMRTELDRKEKEYREVSLDEVRADIESAKQQVEEGYENAKSDAPRRPPYTEMGVEQTRVDVKTYDESSKFAGIPTTRSQFKLFADAVDQESGETVTFKVTYDAWMATEIPGQDELNAYHNAYAEALGVSFDEEHVSLAGALSSAGVDMSSFDEKRASMSGYPMKVTVRVGSVLTAAQKRELAEMAVKSKKNGGGGFGGIKVDVGGGLGGIVGKAKESAQDAVTDKVTTTLTDKLAESLFGTGTMSDEDGDLVFYTMTSEVKKIETKSIKSEVFEVPEEYRAAEQE